LYANCTHAHSSISLSGEFYDEFCTVNFTNNILQLDSVRYNQNFSVLGFCVLTMKKSLYQTSYIDANQLPNYFNNNYLWVFLTLYYICRCSWRYV